MATLHVHLPGSGVVAHELSGKNPVSIGWASDNMITLKDSSVSQTHAEIVCEGEKYRVRDLGSANKCWLNGVAVTEAEIQDGDSIRFGNVETIFRLHSPPAAMQAEATLRGRLILNIPGQGETVFRCEGPLVTVGWKSDNTVRIQEPSISGHHAQFAIVRGKYRLKDLDSTNKTLINGHSIIEAEVNDGDHIQFGAVEGVFKLEYRIDPLPAAPEADAAVKALAAQLQEQQAKMEALLKERESLDFHNKQLSTQLQEATARSEKAETKARELGEKIESEIARTTASEQALKTAREALQASSAEAQAQLEALAQKLEVVKTSSSAEKQAQMDALTKERDALQAACVEAESRASAVAKERDLLQASAADAQCRIEALIKERDALQASAAEAQSRMEALAKERDELKASSTEAQSRIQLLTNERDVLQASLVEAQDRISTQTQERQALQTAVDEAQTKIEALTKGAQSTIEALTKERDALQASASAEAQSRIDALTRERDAFQSSSTEAQSIIEALTKERDALQASASAEAQSRIDALTEARDALKTALTEAQGQIAALTLERDALRNAAAHPAAEKPRNEELLAAKMPTYSEPLSRPKPPALSLMRDDAPSPNDPKASLIQIAKPILPTVQSPALHPRVRNSTTLKFDMDGTLLKAIVETAPETLNGMRRCLHAFIKNQGETQLLDQLLADLQELTQQTSKANLTAVSTLALALETLIEDLMKIPGQINPSSLRTVSQSIDFLVTLLDEKNLFRTREPYSANIIAVDDDSDARKTIRGAIEAVNLRVICAEDSKTTLAVVIEKKFDLIFIDVGLPDMNGFELCTRLRKLPDYKKTPVVFITGAVTVQNRVQSSLSGGNDFIAKPFNLLELGVKALIWIFKGQLGLI